VSEADDLKTAQTLVAAGQKGKALPLLWRLYGSTDPNIKIYVVFALLAALDRLTQNDLLIEVTDNAIAAASASARREVYGHLLGKKAEFLCDKLSWLVYRQHSLNLAAGVFEWIGFSLEEDRLEFDKLSEQRKRLEEEIASLIATVLVEVGSSQDHYMKGHTFVSLGEISFSHFLTSKIDLIGGGRIRHMLMNAYYVRRFNLDTFVGYKRANRRRITRFWKDSVTFYRTAIAEFEAAKYNADLAHALHGLAVKFALNYRFFRAGQTLRRAKHLAEIENQTSLLASIADLEQTVKDKYKHPRNYVQKLGLDLPRGLQN
jgi:hypothetical protein